MKKGGRVFLSNVHFRKMRQRYVAAASCRQETHVAGWVTRSKTTYSDEICGKDSQFLCDTRVDVVSNVTCSDQETASVRAALQRQRQEPDFWIEQGNCRTCKALKGSECCACNSVYIILLLSQYFVITNPCVHFANLNWLKNLFTNLSAFAPLLAVLSLETPISSLSLSLLLPTLQWGLC